MKNLKSTNRFHTSNRADRKAVEEALKKSLEAVNSQDCISSYNADDQSSVTSLLIHDILGGEIMKTQGKGGWHFYNLINGERIDYTKKEPVTKFEENCSKEMLSSPDETYNYFEKEDYMAYFFRFIRAFEEFVGLDKFRTGFSS